MIGMFVNIVPYRSPLDPRTNFTDLLQKTKQECINTYRYSCLPFQEIIKQVREMDSENSSPLQQPFQTLFTYEDKQYTSLQFLGKKCTNYNDEYILRLKNTAQFDISLSLTKTISDVTNKPHLFGSIEYSCDLFEPTAIAIIVDRFQSLLEQLFSSSSTFDIEKQSVYELSILLPQETKLLHGMNETHVDFGQIHCIHHEFIRYTVDNPQKLCIYLDDQSLTY
ncbi:unnamed protein product, partial [Didymodactylos carnosus]